ncbi:serine/threonine protein kinase [Stigmatella hybrida]|uniref:serine/threonine protein kinase n=1 Tax=Stigmatella hybrida TaxID=394097 RepID=UPI001CDAB0A8|nr:protein kinase [Stigmatella hybrida]
MTDALHPDHLKPGDMVGPWRIIESLGSGNFGHAFKAERDGELFTLKMAIRPASELTPDTPEKALEQRQVDGRMRHEAATLMANTSLPGLPNMRAVDRWPHSTKGYIYIVTDYVAGEPFHHWRERTRPNAAQLVDIFLEVVRAVGRLHRRRILIRDFKSEHVIVGPDGKPTMVDLGSAWLPGASTLTVGLAPGTPHLLPPECVTFLREGTWKQGARFEVGVAGDLYQLGVFMYEALTNCWPFDPRLTAEELLTAIQTIIPRAPHRMNPEVPEPLSRIVMRLLEKLPEYRYESAEALHQALWDAAKERTKKAWKVRLVLSPEGPAPMTQDEVEEIRLHRQETDRRVKEAQKQKAEELSNEQLFEQVSATFKEMATELETVNAKATRRKKWWRRIALVAGPLLLGLALFTAWREWRSPAIAHAASEKGSPLMFPLSNSWPARAAAAWLCAAFSVGCPAAQVRPLPEDCPQDTVRSMEAMNLFKGAGYRIIIDINQPGTNQQVGTYSAGPVVSRVVKYEWTGPLPDSTLLYGQLWTEGLTKEGPEAVLGRYTEALLPNGRRVPVCFVLGDQTGLTIKHEGSKPGEARLPREWSALAVRRWP